MVGRQPGRGAQRISIGNGCAYLGVVVHEIGIKNLSCFFNSMYCVTSTQLVLSRFLSCVVVFFL